MKRILHLLIILFFLAIAFFIARQTVLATTSNDTLVGYWKFDETTAGSTAIDSSGLGYNGTPVNSPSPSTNVPFTTFPNARSLSFNGSNQYVNMSSFVSTASAYTFAAWVYPTSLNQGSTGGGVGGTIIDADEDGGTDGYDLGIENTNQIWWWPAGGADVRSSGTVPLDKWSHIALTYQSDGTVKMYINGVLDSTTYGTVAPQLATFFRIGKQSHITGYWQGNLDDVRMYTRALSGTEIAALAAGNHTTATWMGGTSTNYETGSNWNIGAVPDPYTILAIGSSSATYQPTMTANDSAAGLTIKSGSTLTLGGFNLNFNDTSATSGLATISGTLALQGGETLSGFDYSNVSSGGTVKYNGSSSYNSLDLGNKYYNLAFNGSGSWTLNTALITNNNFTLTSGTVISGGNTITVDGNWSNSGTFTASTGTVILNGTNQTISGTTTFYNFTKTGASSATLTFPASLTTTISNTLTLQGAANNLLALQSSINGTQFKIDPQGTRTLSYLNPQDSNNINATAIAYNNTFTYGTNLTNWSAPTPTTTPTPSSTPNNNSSNNPTQSLPSVTSCTNTQPATNPNLFEVTTSPTTATLYFTPVTPSTGYVISYGTTFDANQYSASFSYSDTSGAIPYTINSLNENTMYYFKVQGVSGCMPGNWSQIVSGLTTGNEAVSQPEMNQSGLTQQSTPTSTPKPAKTISIVKQTQTAKLSGLQECTYTVQPGDSLWSIAQNKLGSGNKYQTLIDQNTNQYPSLSSHLSPGMQLQINCPDSPQLQPLTTHSGYDLAVTVQNNGKPVTGVIVELHSIPMRTITDKNGVARFSNVESGNHTIILAYSGYKGQDNITVKGNKKDISINISIQLNYDSMIPIIMGIVITVLLIVVAILLILLFKKKKKRQDENSTM